MVEVIAVFDIGKTNKKLLLFDKNLALVSEHEQKFPLSRDEDGFECDDIIALEKWIIETLGDVIRKKHFLLKSVNFSTYGATLMYLDEKGRSLTPAYNYLKPMPEEIPQELYSRHGGVDEFSRRTASPALGFLNSGLQILWLKKTRPDIFKQVRSILHFPQYFSHLLTRAVTSEHTSIGCHTALWDFDNMKYHPWVEAEGIDLPDPVTSKKALFPCSLDGFEFSAGTGIHDSSAALAPYIMQSREKFILLSTGTWCINMNPFNHEPLTGEQLKNDCLSYMSINRQPLKSSRFFMGHIHDSNLEHLNSYFNKSKDAYREVKINNELISRLSGSELSFFKNGIPEGYIDYEIDLSGFPDFETAYHRLIMDLTRLCIESVSYILPENDDIKNVYVTGGFAKNRIFLKYLSDRLENKRVFTSEINNASALGAAMAVYEDSGLGRLPDIDLGLTEVNF